MKWTKKIADRLKIIKLCIKYPYLYPRNRWTDRHWNNWKMANYLHGDPFKKTTGIYQKAFKTNVEKHYKREVKNIFYVIWYYLLTWIFIDFLSIFHCIPNHTEWDAIPKGWRIAFGDQLLEELDQAIRKSPDKNYRKKIRIMQIKEKWGYLNIYLNYYSGEVDKVIEKYEDISYKTCIDCGQPATHYTRGWIVPLCDACYEKYENR